MDNNKDNNKYDNDNNKNNVSSLELLIIMARRLSIRKNRRTIMKGISSRDEDRNSLPPKLQGYAAFKIHLDNNVRRLGS